MVYLPKQTLVLTLLYLKRNKMAHTEADLDNLINEVLDSYKDNSDTPYIKNLVNRFLGRKRLFTSVKKIILEQGMTDIDAILIQIEATHDWNNE